MYDFIKNILNTTITYYNELSVLPHTLILIGVIMVPLLIVVAYYTYAERKIIASMQGRLGPNVVGPKGLLQPFADGVKLFFKEIVIPTDSNKFLFLLAPVITFTVAFAAWAVIPFDSVMVLSDINAGLLYVLAMTSLGIYGIIIAGWASNSKYALLGAMRSASLIIAYEIAMGFALVGVIMVSGSLNLGDIIDSQKGSVFHWFWVPLFPLFVIYFISGVAETNRAPFDVAEGESELVAGFHVEYSGMGFAVFFIAEYANMILISALTTILFFGGWLSPFNISSLGNFELNGFVNNILLFLINDGIHWFIIKTFFFMFCFIWFRATFPRYRYDQIMRLGWKILIPITLVWIFVEMIFIYYEVEPWFAQGAVL
jgi:NADH-quinone oxidoreductase subunit H